jgi:hypothetical protein
MVSESVTMLHCNFCQHDNKFPRIENPRRCPRCGNEYGKKPVDSQNTKRMRVPIAFYDYVYAESRRNKMKPDEYLKDKILVPKWQCAYPCVHDCACTPLDEGTIVPQKGRIQLVEKGEDKR